MGLQGYRDEVQRTVLSFGHRAFPHCSSMAKATATLCFDNCGCRTVRQVPVFWVIRVLWIDEKADRDDELRLEEVAIFGPVAGVLSLREKAVDSDRCPSPDAELWCKVG